MPQRSACPRALAALVVMIGGMLALHPASALSALYTVNTTADARDANPGDGKCETAAGNETCSLRAAVEEANAATETTTISLPPGTYVLGQTVSCAFQFAPDPSNYSVAPSQALCIDRNVVLVGSAAEATIIDGNLPSGDLGLAAPVFFVGAGATVDIRGVTIRRGNYSIGSLTGHGGGIRNAGKLNIVDSIVSDNFTTGSGGGAIYNTGALTVLRSRLVRNFTTQGGGAIGNFAQSGWPGGTVRIQDSQITQNTAAYGGGLANFQGEVAISGTTLSDNTAGQGGGIWNGSFNTMTLTNVTVSGNRANNGGGVTNEFGASMTLDNVTIANNTAKWASEDRGIGGGLMTADNATTTLRNSIVARNFAQEAIGPDCYTGRGTLTSGGHNLLGNIAHCGIAGDATGNLVGVDPLLGLLADNGGSAPTHALAAGSPAIGAGSPAVPGSGPGACAATDQLAFVRPIGARCDMGATEQRGGFSVAKVSPRRGGNQGSVSAGIVGTGFRAGATVSLRRAGEPDIPGQPVFVDAGGSAISVAFDLNGRPPGPWDVAVTIPGGSVVTLADAFTIEAGGTADLWVDAVGFLRRPGRRSTFTVVYGNRGSVDALGVPLSLSIPQGYQAALHVPIEPPPAQTGEVRPPWHGVSPLVAQPAQDSFLQLPLFLPIVPSGSTMTFSVALTAPVNADDTFMMAAIGRPSMTPGAPATQFVSDAIAGARSYLQQAAGIVVPTAVAAQMQPYAATQFDTVVASGRTAIAASLGTRTPIYSLAQLQLDLAFFAAARAAQPTASPGSR